jgi:choice-of-anchor C domain-containing protein
MKIQVSVLIAALLLAVVLGPRAGGDDQKADKEKDKNLLVNGSFEEGPEVGADGFLPVDVDSKAIKGWVVTRGQIDYIGTYWTAADGKRSLDLHGSPGYGGIKQTFATKKGQKYRVTFSMAGNVDGQVAEKKLGVKAAGMEEKFTFNAACKSRTDMGWTTQVWDFTATDKESTLEFFTLMDSDPNCGPALDNVSVVAVEEG